MWTWWSPRLRSRFTRGRFIISTNISAIFLIYHAHFLIFNFLFTFKIKKKPRRLSEYKKLLKIALKKRGGRVKGKFQRTHWCQINFVPSFSLFSLLCFPSTSSVYEIVFWMSFLYFNVSLSPSIFLLFISKIISCGVYETISMSNIALNNHTKINQCVWTKRIGKLPAVLHPPKLLWKIAPICLL